MDIGCFTDVTAPFVAAYDEILKGSLATFLQLTNQIGGDLSKMVSIVLNITACTENILTN